MIEDIGYHNIIRVFVGPLLVVFSARKYRHLACILASEMMLGSMFLWFMDLFVAGDGIYYDIVALSYSLLFFNLLLYRPSLSKAWEKRHINARIGCGCLLFLANAIFYMCLLGEHLSNLKLESTNTVFMDAYYDVMVALQVFQFGLLIWVIDIGRLNNILRGLSNAGNSLRFWRYSYSMVYGKVMPKRNRASPGHT